MLPKDFSVLRKSAVSSEIPTPTPEPETISSPNSGPQVNFDLLRESIKESEARKAQADLDRMVKEAADKQTVSLLAKVSELQKRLERAELDASVAEEHAAGTMEELNRLRTERDSLNIALTDTRREMQQAIDMYEAQLRALHGPY